MSKQLADMPAGPATWVNDGDGNEFAPDGQVVPPGGAAHLLGITMRQKFALQLLGAEMVANGAPAAVLEDFQKDNLVQGAINMADRLLEALTEPPAKPPEAALPEFNVYEASEAEKQAVLAVCKLTLFQSLPRLVREYLEKARYAIDNEDEIPF